LNHNGGLFTLTFRVQLLATFGSSEQGIFKGLARGRYKCRVDNLLNTFKILAEYSAAREQISHEVAVLILSIADFDAGIASKLTA